MRERFKVVTLTTTLLALGILASDQPKQARFNPDGSFRVVGEAPNEFFDFCGINLNSRRVPRLCSQRLQLVNGKTFHFKTLIVLPLISSMTTVTICGIHYTFSGRFHRG